MADRIEMYHPDLPESQTIRVREQAVEAHKRMGFKPVPKSKQTVEKEKSA